MWVVFNNLLQKKIEYEKRNKEFYLILQLQFTLNIILY